MVLHCSQSTPQCESDDSHRAVKKPTCETDDCLLLEFKTDSNITVEQRKQAVVCLPFGISSTPGAFTPQCRQQDGTQVPTDINIFTANGEHPLYCHFQDASNMKSLSPHWLAKFTEGGYLYLPSL